jgi:hypothetical protein
MIDLPTAEALLHLSRVAADAGRYIRRSRHLKPDEAALLVAEIGRLRLLVGEDASAFMQPLPRPPGRFAHAS